MPLPIPSTSIINSAATTIQSRARSLKAIKRSNKVRTKRNVAATTIQSRARSLKAIKRSNKFRTIRIINEEKKNECAICQDQMIFNKDVSVLECGHKFHDKCLENIIQYGHINCPICRELISDNVRRKLALISRKDELTIQMARLEEELRNTMEEQTVLIGHLAYVNIAKMANSKLTHELTESVKQSEARNIEEQKTQTEKRDYAQAAYNESERVYNVIDNNLTTVKEKIRDLLNSRHTIALEIFDLINQIRQFNIQQHIAYGKKRRNRRTNNRKTNNRRTNNRRTNNRRTNNRRTNNRRTKKRGL
jgi:hypothetical protein